MLIYFAGPLFSQGERDFNMSLTKQIEELGLDVFLPQRDGAERDKPPYSLMSREDRRQAMFNIDLKNVLAADVFLFILDGRVPDEGACVELGLAYAHKIMEKNNKILVGLQTDIRAAFLGAKLNPMVKVPLDHVFETTDELLGFLKSAITGVTAV